MMRPALSGRPFGIGALLLLTAAAAGSPSAEPDGSGVLLLRRWPMFGQNFQHSSRTVFPGAQTSAVRWYLPPTTGTFSTDPVVADDGTVLVGDLFQCPIGCIGGTLYAIDPAGTEKWRVPLGGNPRTPAIAPDGTIYVPVEEFRDRLVALDPDGAEKWEFDPGITGAGFTPATLGPDGTVLFSRIFECPVSVCDSGALYAVNPDGTLKFRFSAKGEFSAVAVGFDGRVYVSAKNGAASALHALSPTGVLRWRLPTGAPTTAPVTWVGSVYVGVGRWIVAVNENGTLRWVYPAGGTVNAISVAGDGTVYAAVRDQFGLYALNSNGTLRWVFRNPLNPRVGIGEVFAAPSLSGTGIAYVMSAWNAPPSLRGVYAVNLDGSLRWRRSTTGSVPPVVTPSVAIDANQTVYVVGLGLLSIGP